MAVVSKIVHCYQLMHAVVNQSFRRISIGMLYVTLPLTVVIFYPVATKLAYKTHAVDDKCMHHAFVHGIEIRIITT